jgi:hypothetical protein
MSVLSITPKTHDRGAAGITLRPGQPPGIILLPVRDELVYRHTRHLLDPEIR